MSNNPSVEDTIVLNTSPLIVLFKAELEFVLSEVFKRIVVPEAVWQEVSVYDDEAFKGLSKATWLRREEISIDNRIVVWNLGNGESQVLSCALKKPDHIAVIDIGTAGLLVLASRQNLISSLASALSQVRKAGLYLTDDLVERLILGDKKDL